MVLIDRQNSASAIEAMTPLVDAMRIEGKSVCLSPEGTRAVTPKLAEFKKGAFHLAMQAGVPMVPIVIHNSSDVQPKGDITFHPGTVEVEVLPPVDTSAWSVDTIDTHVADVRNLFLDALGQERSREEVVATKKPRAKTKARKKSVRKAAKIATVGDADSETRH